MLRYSALSVMVVLFSYLVEAQTVDAKGLIEILALGEDVNILDARELEEYDVSHLKNAIHIGYKKFNLNETLAKINFNKRTFVYCSVGYRSGRVVSRINKVLSKKGIQAINLKGGIFGWVNIGGKVYTHGKETNQVHGYNKEWSQKVKKHQNVVLPKTKKWFFF